MSLETSESLVAEGDPDRYHLLRMMSGEGRARLLALYALNVAMRRAAWASEQPLVAEMRLQWWLDALEELGHGEPPRAHPVLEDCRFLQGEAEICSELVALAEARRWDIWAEPFSNTSELWHYLEDTGGRLMGLAARLMGAGAEGQGVAREFGAGAALAAWFIAVPALLEQERPALPDASPEGIKALAAEGILRMNEARKRRRLVPKSALVAMLPGWQAEALLRQVIETPEVVLEGRIGLSEMHRRGSLAWRAISGRW